MQGIKSEGTDWMNEYVWIIEWISPVKPLVIVYVYLSVVTGIDAFIPVQQVLIISQYSGWQGLDKMSFLHHIFYMRETFHGT